MRHLYTQRLAITVAAIVLTAAVLFGALAAGNEPAAPDRIDEVLALDGDALAGADIYGRLAQPTCSSCHDPGRFESFDDRRRVVVSLVTDGIDAHSAQRYRSVLSDQQVADVAKYVVEHTP